MRGSLDGVTEVRAGVYMFGDLFQAEIGTHGLDRHRADGAHQRDRSPAGAAAGRCRRPGAFEGPQHRGRRRRITASAWCSTSTASAATAMPSCAEPIRNTVSWSLIRRCPLDLPIGAKLRIAPNHTCMTAAAHDRYYVVEGGDEVVAIWSRVNGW